MTRPLPDFISIGKIVKARGIRGEVKVIPLTDCPARFKELSIVQVERPNRETMDLEIEHVSLAGRYVKLQFKEVDSREAAQSLRGAFINISKADLLPLAEDEYYLFELIGLCVRTEAGEILGEVVEVLELRANNVLIVRHNEKERLIPMIRDVVKELDWENEEIIISPLEGLLDL